jgi:SAM-dependent methyltransferase
MLKTLKRTSMETFNRFRAKRAVRRGLFSAYDPEAVERIGRKYPGHGYEKYGRKLRNQFVRNGERIFAVGLHRSKGLRVLDIGCGFGFFVHAADRYGHHAVGLDQDDPFFNEITALVGIERVVHRIEAFQPLPDVPGGPFDLITAFASCFDHAGAEGQWGVKEWEYLLGDLRKKTSESARLHVKFNQYAGGGARPGAACQAVPDELYAYFQSLGAVFSKRTMRLSFSSNQ